MITIDIIGHIGNDAEIREFNGQKYIAFNLASTERYKDAQGNPVSRTTWVSCLKPGESAVLAWLKKGTQVFVRGDLSVRTFNSANGVQAGVNCRVRELQLLSAKQEAQERTPQQQPVATASVPSPASTAAAQPVPVSGAMDDLPF